MKKFKRINRFLEAIQAKDEKIVFNMKWQDLVNVSELAGIGNRTFYDILKAFKTQHNLLPVQKPFYLKKDIVWDYLSWLYDDLGDQFHKIRGIELRNIPELAGIGKTTI
jgi:hypothetical protein